MGEKDRQPTSDELRLWRQTVFDGPVSQQTNPDPKLTPANKPKLGSVIPNPGGLGKHEARAIKRGRMHINDRIDLHGMTQDLAHDELTKFIQRSAESGLKCVLIITGKGTARHNTDDAPFMTSRPGVLRTVVPRWLSGTELRRFVVAFQAALPRDGGAGALYVLLRRG